MSMSDGLGPSIFCRKTEKLPPMREEMDGKAVFLSRRIRHFDLDVVFRKVLFLICTLTWRVNNYNSRRGNDIYRRNESTDLEPFLFMSL